MKIIFVDDEPMILPDVYFKVIHSDKSM